jgi:hypothetical protein
LRVRFQISLLIGKSNEVPGSATNVGLLTGKERLTMWLHLYCAYISLANDRWGRRCYALAGAGGGLIVKIPSGDIGAGLWCGRHQQDDWLGLVGFRRVPPTNRAGAGTGFQKANSIDPPRHAWRMFSLVDNATRVGGSLWLRLKDTVTSFRIGNSSSI